MELAAVAEKLAVSAKDYSSLFDEHGFPKELPGHNRSRSDAAIQSEPVSKWLSTLPRKPLHDALEHSYQGRPLIAPTQAEIAALFPSASSKEPTTGVSASTPSTSAGFQQPAPQAKNEIESTFARALQHEDVLVNALTNAQSAALLAEQLQQSMSKLFQWALAHLQSLRWQTCTWPTKGGNPFTVKLTPATSLQYGVNPLLYWEVVARPMDLVRMSERLEKGTYTAPLDGAPAGGMQGAIYKALETFFGDTDLIIKAAKTFNGPPEYKQKSTPDNLFPHPSTMPKGKGWSVEEGSIYAMAFEFQDTVRRLKAQVAASATILQRLANRQILLTMIRQLIDNGTSVPPNLQEYAGPVSQGVLAAATKATATHAGLSEDMFARLKGFAHS